VAQGEGSELQAQYHKKKKKRLNYKLLAVFMAAI
jgi:hypothetical protein